MSNCARNETLMFSSWAHLPRAHYILMYARHALKTLVGPSATEFVIFTYSFSASRAQIRNLSIFGNSLWIVTTLRAEIENFIKKLIDKNEQNLHDSELIVYELF